jgi:hypothetical protein
VQRYVTSTIATLLPSARLRPSSSPPARLTLTPSGAVTVKRSGSRSLRFAMVKDAV